jgi:glycopeptide antibiotics resistance protein
MVKETFLDILKDFWPMLLIFSVVIIMLRINYLYNNKQKFIFYKEMTYYAFIIYILFLFYVVTFQDVSSSSNLIPFKEMFRYEIGSKLFFRNVVGNMLMFLPYGFFTAYFLKTKKIYMVLISIFITSLTIELTQLSLGRVFDVDDIILNIIGGIAGYFLFKLMTAAHRKIPSKLKKNSFYNIILIVLLILLAIYLI